MNRKALIFAVLTVLMLCFIWGHSIMPADTSEDESRGILSWLKPVVDPQGRIDDNTFHHFLRKTAHFLEYAALGFCMSGFFLNLRWKKPGLRILLAVIACAAAAAIDETIQLFNAGRGPKVTDVLLDTCGAVFGLAVLLLARYLINKRKKTAA